MSTQDQFAPQNSDLQQPLAHTRDGKHKFLVDLDHDLTKSVSKASSFGHCYTLKALGTVTSEGRDGRCKNS